MIHIRRFGKVILLLGLALLGCIEPNKENIWQLNHITTLNTNGYCRNVDIVNDTAYVAAGQAGLQVWDLAGLVRANSLPQMVIQVDSISALHDFDDITQVIFNKSNKLIFALEYNNRVSVMDFQNPAQSVFLGEEMSEQTKEIRVLGDAGRFSIYAADNNDGLKWNYFERDSIYPVWINSAGSEIPSIGKPTGIDILGNILALTIDQLGVELYRLDGLNENPVKIGAMDTDGNANSVTFKDSTVIYIAAQGGGAYYIPVAAIIQNGTGQATETSDLARQFAQDLKVLHVAVNGTEVVLSCGATGIALYDLSDPRHPDSKGIFDIGYSYYSVFYDDYLFAATREGLQIFQIKD